MPNAFNEFLLNNSWWIALALALFIALVAGIMLIAAHRAARECRNAPKPIDKDLYLFALGGPENVTGHHLEGSRIIVTLKDYALVDRAKLKEAGVSGFIMMSDRLTLVIKGEAAAVYSKIFG